MDHTAELLKVCGIAILCTACILIIGKTADGLSFALRMGGGILIFGAVAVMLGENIGELRVLMSYSASGSDSVASAFAIMLKALGIAFISKFCADVCRDCGEGTLAGGVESMGRIAIISLCIPILTEILGYAAKILETGS